jgi:hypothetical protein
MGLMTSGSLFVGGGGGRQLRYIERKTRILIAVTVPRRHFMRL